MQQPVMPSSTPSNITTEQIQKCLDDNKKLILAILDNQNLGKLAECAQYQTQLQKNLMYLAAIADAQPQAQTIPSQMVPHPAMQQGGFYMQHPQAAAAAAAAAAMAQQPAGIFSQKVPLQFNNQPAIQGQMVMRPGGAHSEAALGGGPLPTAGPSGGNKQDASEAGASGTDGGGDEESSYLKGSEEAK